MDTALRASRVLSLVGGLFAVLLCGGCHRMLVDGEPLATRHVMAGRTSGGGLTDAELFGVPSPAPASGYISRNAYLEPLRDVLDRSIGGDLDILSPVRPMTLRPEASTIIYTNFGTPQGLVDFARNVRSDDASNPFVDVRLDLLFLPGQYQALAAQVNPLLAFGGVATLPLIPLPAFPDPPLFRNFFDRFVIQLPGGRPLPGGVTDAFWAPPVPSIGEDPNHAVLVLEVRPYVDDALDPTRRHFWFSTSRSSSSRSESSL